MSYGQRKCANDELLSYFQVEAPIHRPSFFLFFSLTIKDKTNILHLRQGSFTRKVRTVLTLKIIASIFVKLFLILVLHLRQFFIVRIFVKRATDSKTCFRYEKKKWTPGNKWSVYYLKFMYNLDSSNFVEVFHDILQGSYIMLSNCSVVSEKIFFFK